MKVQRGFKKDGEPYMMYIDQNLAKVLEVAKERVGKKNWDYVGLICGLPGSGKSTLSWTLAKYLDPSFSHKRVAFTAEEFLTITKNCPEYSAIVLDESFQSLNTRVTMSPEFLRIINHLQIIRQKHLFIFLCLPNFFDLSQDIAIFRASHLFYVYEYDNGMRGRFRFYDRNSKTRLYVMGKKFMNYDCVRGIFFGNFYDDEVVDEEKYLKMKEEHLKSQEKREKISKSSVYFAKVLNLITERKIFTMKELEDHTGCNASTLQSIKTRYLPST